MDADKVDSLLKWADSYHKRVVNDHFKSDKRKMIKEKSDIVSMIKTVLDHGSFDYNNLVVAMVMLVMNNKDDLDVVKLREIVDGKTIFSLGPESTRKMRSS
jgi:hypothetical protein